MGGIRQAVGRAQLASSGARRAIICRRPALDYVPPYKFARRSSGDRLLEIFVTTFSDFSKNRAAPAQF
jgi:hypothetical protein